MLKVEEEEETPIEGGVEPGSGQWIETVGEAGSGKSRRGNVWVADLPGIPSQFSTSPLVTSLYPACVFKMQETATYKRSWRHL